MSILKVGVYAQMYVCRLCVPEAQDGQKTHQSPWNWNYRWLGATMLGTDPRPSPKVTSTLNH